MVVGIREEEIKHFLVNNFTSTSSEGSCGFKQAMLALQSRCST